MNPRRLFLLITWLWLPAASVVAQTPAFPAIFPDEDPETSANYRLVWPTTSGQRYEVRQSTNLQTWTIAPDFPVVATGLVMELPFLAADAPRFFKVLALDGPTIAPAGMAYIPSGPFQMGDTFLEGYGYERPVHTVQVSAFFMDQFETSRELWLEVYGWALTHGYTFAHAGSSRAALHPVHSLNWYDAVKWCNARSEKEGLTPCYCTDAGQSEVYRTGELNLANDAVKWTANGYRLPTEAEWEKAARGGQAGQRFPWGNTVSHSQANYFSSGAQAYDANATRGAHPDYGNGASPCGAFPPNGYGVFELAGNLSEWTWDAYGDAWYDQAEATAADCHGPLFQDFRVVRGGTWSYTASNIRCASRVSWRPINVSLFTGFRCVRSL